MVTTAYIFIWSYELFCYYIVLAWNDSWWCINFWINWLYHLLLGSLLASPPFKDPPTLCRLVVFNHFDWFVFIIIVFYDAYHVIPNPPMKFQAYTLSFGWVFGVVALQLPPSFHCQFSFLKPHGLILDHGG